MNASPLDFAQLSSRGVQCRIQSYLIPKALRHYAPTTVNEIATFTIRSTPVKLFLLSKEA